MAGRAFAESGKPAGESAIRGLSCAGRLTAAHGGADGERCPPKAHQHHQRRKMDQQITADRSPIGGREKSRLTGWRADPRKARA
jgi:hypothetical protein